MKEEVAARRERRQSAAEWEAGQLRVRNTRLGAYWELGEQADERKNRKSFRAVVSVVEVPSLGGSIAGPDHWKQH